MSGTLLLVIVIILVTIAYFTYGGYLAEKLGVDVNEKTPAHKLSDNVDYSPANRWIVLGHHFASIAGVGPIVGPVIAAAFGWLPVYLWILVGGIFMGAVHDFASTMASLRNQGKSMGEVIKQYIGTQGKRFFIIFSFATMLLVIAVFTNVIATTFAQSPAIATASVYFIALALLFGFINRYQKLPFWLITIAGVVLLFSGIPLAQSYPLVLSENAELATNIWKIILLIYIFISAVSPIWMLIQPRDYLNSFLLYAVMFGSLIGVFFLSPSMEMSSFEGFRVPMGEERSPAFLFPILFVTVACGAISGFHSLVSSGTTAKQINSQRDVKFIAYGGMLVEVVLAGIAIIAVASLATGRFTELYNNGEFVQAFAEGAGSFIASLPLLNISLEGASGFVGLAVSAFALTSLDTCCRLARFLFQEYFEDVGDQKTAAIMKNRYTGTAIAVVLSAGLIFSGGAGALWPLFGASNQLLAALALLAATGWLARKKQTNWFVKIPMVFMFVVTISALINLIYSNFLDANYKLGVIAVLLLALALTMTWRAWNTDVESEEEEKKEAA